MEYKVGDYVWLRNGLLVQLSSKEIIGWYTTRTIGARTYDYLVNFSSSGRARQWMIKRKANIKNK